MPRSAPNCRSSLKIRCLPNEPTEHRHMYVAEATAQDTLYAGYYRNVRQAVAARNALAFVLMAQKNKDGEKKDEKRWQWRQRQHQHIHITKPFSLSLDLSFSQPDTDIGADRGRDRDNVHLVFAFKKKTREETAETKASQAWRLGPWERDEILQNLQS